ncbi:bifunctional acetate--CoA ligase family protein/GNAT family N-acetyltransferase [Neisseria musculi]|uniref:Acetyltransferase family protein n=1 Tax=Neisseria musculi TaxID=1815583 RepID=A0A7H1M819_9NEIS|nr:bifunctional acetate--CoA ligase family protein/GNAT family N-acetyltransferase [Neisseria musculi]QNT57784.1 acetyltransferase family protein [Neisseria musculi]
MHNRPVPLSPRHLVVIGASERPHSLGERVLTALLRTPFHGQITPVNLHRKTVGGIKAYANLSRIPDAADMVLVLTPPASYEAVLKACRKQNIPHTVLVQDWDNLSADTLAQAQEAVQKARKYGINISVCHPAAIQVPALGLNSGILPDLPAGGVGIISGNASESARLPAQITQAGPGVSYHIGLHYPLSPTVSADFIDMLAADPATRLIAVTHNPHENQRRLFSAIRRAARRKPVLLSVSHYADPEEQAVLQAISRRCGCVLAFTPDETAAAIQALAAGSKPARKLHIIANEPCGSLQTHADTLGITLHPLPGNERPSENLYGNIGSNPAPARYRALAENCLQHHQTEALLAIVAPTADNTAENITRLMAGLQRQTGKPLFISSPFSDGLLQFPRPAQALQAFRCQNIYTDLKQQQNQTAKPLPGHLKTPSARGIEKMQNNLPQLAESLCLPEHKTPEANPQFVLTFKCHPRYGAALYARTPVRTLAVLPPFTTLDAEYLIRQTGLKRHQKTIHQLLHSLNTAASLPFISEISVSAGSTGISSNIKTDPQAETAENVFAPYPAKPAHTFTLKNGQTVRIRPLLPEDAEAKQNFVRSLPEEQRYTRYMMHLAELSPAMLARACNLDYTCESAVVAETESGIWLGVARFSSTDTAGRCEFGITTTPAVQGQGLAAHLMAQIIQTAKQQGYREMSAEILQNNTAMLKLAGKLGFTFTPSPHDNALTEAVLTLDKPKNTPVNNIKHNLKQQILALKS